MIQQTKAASKFIVEYVIRDKDGNIKAQGVEGCENDLIIDKQMLLKGKIKLNTSVQSMEDKDAIEFKVREGKRENGNE